MISHKKSFGIALIIAALLALLSGCEQKGPAEKAGEKLDQTTQKAADKIEESGEKIRGAVRREE